MDTHINPFSSKGVLHFAHGLFVIISKYHPFDTVLTVRIVFRLPADPDIKQSWLEFIKRHTLKSIPKNVFLCSLHFEKDCFEYLSNTLRLKKNSVPTIHFNSRQISEVSRNYKQIFFNVNCENYILSVTHLEQKIGVCITSEGDTSLMKKVIKQITSGVGGNKI